MKKNKHEKNRLEFSKTLLVQESILIWITTIIMLVLAFLCILNEYIGDLPWLAVMVGLPWTAYGVSQVYYYKKAQAENTKNGIKYETVLLDEEEEECLDEKLSDEEDMNEEHDEDIIVG